MIIRWLKPTRLLKGELLKTVPFPIYILDSVNAYRTVNPLNFTFPKYLIFACQYLRYNPVDRAIIELKYHKSYINEVGFHTAIDNPFVKMFHHFSNFMLLILPLN